MLKKLKNIKLSKRKYFYLVLSSLIIIAIGTTFAYWRWSSDINALVNGKVCAPEIVFVGGTTINGHDLLPVRTKEEGLSKNIQVNLNNTCDNDTAVLNLNLLLESFPSGLSDASFKWALYEVTTEEVEGTSTETLTFINNGNFANKSQNNTISLATDLIVTENISTYRLFIWIDGTMDNPSTIGDNSFKFKLYGTGRDAIYREYTMKQVSNSSTTKSFWGSPINANQVKSIRFIPTDQVSDDWTNTYNLSSVADSQDVTMYYVENGQTEGETPITLYDVYVASNNGMSKIKTNTSAAKMFAYLSNCEYIDADGLDTSNATSMAYMFLNDYKLQEVKLSKWDTSNVKNMERMFMDSSSLKSLDLSGFDTSNVTIMNSSKMYEGMFSNCTHLEVLNISSFDTSNIDNFNYMFNNCKALKALDLSNFDTSKATSLKSMFLNCSSLNSLDLSNFDTSNVTDISESNGKQGMFAGCSNLVYLNISSFDTSEISNMGDLFKNCSKLKSLDLSNFDTSNVTTIDRIFQNCTSLEYLNVSNWSNDKLTGLSFSGLTNLKTLVLDNFKTDNFTTMNNMFYNCYNLNNLDLHGFKTSNVKNMERMFYNCSSLTTLDLSSFDTSNVTSMYGMFWSCTALTELDLSNFDTSLVTSVTYMFAGDSRLISLNLASFNFNNNISFTDIFKWCSSLNKIDFSSLDVSKVTGTLAYPSKSAEIILKDCEQYDNFTTKFGTGYTNLHTVNNDNCTV